MVKILYNYSSIMIREFRCMKNMLCVKLLLFYIALFVFSFNVSALDIPKIGEEIVLTKCEFNGSYLEWEKLSLEEK